MGDRKIPDIPFSLRKKIGLAIRRFRMISPNDRILIGLSGGKDSLLLALAMAGLRRRSPVPFSLEACCVDITGGETDTAPLETFCAGLGIPFSVRKHPILGIIEVRKERSPCSLCANIRRGILNSEARERGCSVLALGHNLDDAVETALMNLFHAGRFRSFQPKYWQSRTDMTVIRPLIFAEERSIEKAVRHLSLPVLPYTCPFSKETERARAKDLLAGLGANNPRIKYNIVHALQSIDPRDGWTEKEREETHGDSSCGETHRGEMTWQGSTTIF